MSDDNSPQKGARPQEAPPPKLSRLGTLVLARIVRELASFDCLNYKSNDPERREHSVFADDIYDDHNRNFPIGKPYFHRVIDELIEKGRVLYKDTLDGLTVTLNPACVALEGIRQKVYSVPPWLAVDKKLIKSLREIHNTVYPHP